MDEKTIARFWSKVDKRGPDECWPWMAFRDRKGYGKFGIASGGKWTMLLAHRVSAALDGRVCDGVFVCHSCDNPPCCNPAHLWIGTNSDNAADMRAKGRGRLPPRKVGESNHAAIMSEALVAYARGLRSAGWRYSDIGSALGLKMHTVNKAVRGINWGADGGARAVSRRAPRPRRRTNEEIACAAAAAPT